MTRPRKQNVDYFPHYCKHGKVLFVLESKYGNDGYAFFYKLLEALGDADGHFIDCSKPEQLEYLTAVSGAKTPQSVTDILNTLSIMSIIDRELWSQGIIWMQSFVDSVSDAYRKRSQSAPVKPLLTPKTPISAPETPPEPPGNPQSKVKERKVKRILCVYSDAFEAFWKIYPKKTAKKAAYQEWEKATEKPPLDVILSAVESQKRAKQKAIDTGQFTSEWPDPERWIKKARWEDDPESLTGKYGGNGNGRSGRLQPQPREITQPPEWKGIDLSDLSPEEQARCLQRRCSPS